MAHTLTTAPAITPVPANPSTGSIAGFRVDCPACGFTFTSSLRGIAENDARDHVAYMLRKESDSSWRSVVRLVDGNGEAVR